MSPTRKYEAFLDAGLGRLADKAVAEQLNVTRQRVQQVRKTLNISPDPDRRKRELKEAALRNVVARLGPRDEKVLACWQRLQNVNQVAVKLCIPYMSVKNALLRHGVDPPLVKHEIDWASVDWDKPTSQIAEDLQTTASYVSRMRTAFEARGVRTRRSAPTRPMKEAKKRAEHLATTVDWNRPNYLVADLLNTSPRHVTTIRRDLRRRGFDIPEAPRLGPKKKTRAAEPPT